MRSGRWVIRSSIASASTIAKPSSSNAASKDHEEYVVNLNHVDASTASAGFGVHGAGVGTSGRSKGGHVEITGAIRGSTLTLVEEWRDDGVIAMPSLSQARSASASCIITADLSVDGSRFEGSYRNTQNDSIGKVAGVYNPRNDVICRSNFDAESHRTLETSTLLAQAACRLATNVSLGSSAEDLLEVCCAECELPTTKSLELLSSSKLIAKGKGSLTNKDVAVVRNLYSVPDLIDDEGQGTTAHWEEAVFSPLLQSTSSVESTAENAGLVVSEVTDDRVTLEAGGKGSLSMLDPDLYRSARLEVVSVLLHHAGLSIDLSKMPVDENIPTETLMLWRRALQITEAGVRRAISDQSPFNGTRKEKCQSYCNLSRLVSDFLLEFPPYRSGGAAPSSQVAEEEEEKEEAEAILSDIATIYSAIQRPEDLAGLNTLLDYVTKCGIARVVSFTCFSILFRDVQCAPSLEAIAASLPRVMKAGISGSLLTLPASEAVQKNGSVPRIGTHFLSGLQGCSFSVQDLVRSRVYDIYSSAGRAFSGVLPTTEKDTPHHFPAASQSLCLSILSTFFTTFEPTDISGILEGSGLLESISSVLSLCRSLMSAPNGSEEGSALTNRAESPESSVEKLLQSSSLRVTRQIARSSLSVLHSCAYQLSSCKSFVPGGQTDSASKLIELLCTHFCEIVAELSEVASKNRTKASSSKAIADWNKRNKICLADGQSSDAKEAKKKVEPPSALASAQVWIEFGLVSQPGRTGGISFASLPKSFYFSGLRQQAQSCLNVLYTIARSTNFARSLSSSDDKIEMLLRFSGLSAQSASPELIEQFVPSRIRTRMIRLLMRLLPFRDPDESIIHCCLHIVGANGDGDVITASAINSLLRHLYASSLPYKLAIDSILLSASGPDRCDDKLMREGLLVFLGGLPSRISEGSFVLLKPPTAAALSPNSPLGKNSSFGGAAAVSTAPLVVGSEAIVTGLCRRDAMAGVVTSIDTGNGTCEVVVFDRNLATTFGENNSTSSSASNVSTKQLGMTVRAIRAQLPDIVSAEEMPLLLDPNANVNAFICGPLREAVDRLSSLSSTDTVPDSEDTQDLTSAMLSIRASIVALSDRGLLRTFVEGGSSSRLILSRLLDFASTTVGRCPYVGANPTFGQGISAIPGHEARYQHLRQVLLEATSRRRCFQSKPISQWEELLADMQKNSKAKKDTDGEESTDDYSSPPARPAAPSRSSFARRVLSEETATSSRGSEATEQTTNRNASAGRSTYEHNDDDGGDDDNEDDDDQDAQEDDEDEHLREAAIVQMAELGLPRSWAELALRRVGGTNIEAAVHFCLERGADMERLLEEERERERRLASDSAGNRRRNASGARSSTDYLIQQLVEMGFPSHWCAEALAATGTSSVDEALTWILTNGERLSAQDTNDEGDEGKTISPSSIRTGEPCIVHFTYI